MLLLINIAISTYHFSRKADLNLIVLFDQSGVQMTPHYYLVGERLNSK
jgi:hypothetical protein